MEHKRQRQAGEEPAKVPTMRRALLIACAFAVFLLSAFPLYAEDWPRFRGPNGSGVSHSARLPEALNPSTNALWKIATPPGTSSPIVSGRRIFLTAHDGNRRLTLCLNAETGEEIWQREVQAARDEPSHPKGGPSAPTPVSDGTNVYVFFPDFGLLA